MARPIDNARLDAFVNKYRCLSGNQPIFKNESARAMLKILKDQGTVGTVSYTHLDVYKRQENA